MNWKTNSMRVLVISENPDRAELSPNMGQLPASAEIVGAIKPNDRLAEAVAEASPDVIVLWVEFVDRLPFAALVALRETNPLPIILITDDERLDVLKEAAFAGVDAYAPVAAGLDSFPAVAAWAHACFQASSDLRAKLRTQESKLADRIIIERAKGVVMKMKGLGEDTAYHEMRKMAMRRSLPMRDVAEQIIDTANLVMSE